VDSTPESHKAAGWAKFTNEVIRIINKDCQNIVFSTYKLIIISVVGQASREESKHC